MTTQQPQPQWNPQGAPPPKRPYSYLAVGGFIASLIGLGLIGLPVSIAGLIVTIRHPEHRGQGLAIAGILLGFVWATINVIFLSSLFTMGGGDA